MAKAAIIRLADYRQQVQAETNIREKLDAEKLAKDSVEVEKKSLTATDILNKNLQDLAKVIKEQGAVGKITDKAMGTKFYGGAKGAIKERVDNIKDFFTLRGFLDKTGIVKRGSTGFLSGIVDKGLERREAKQQYIKDTLKTDPMVNLFGKEKAKQIAGDRFDKIQPAGLALQQNEKELTRLKEAGFTEEQIKRSPEYKKKAELEAGLAKVDPRFRGKDAFGADKKLVEKAKPETSSKRGTNVVPLREIDRPEGDLSEEEIENLRMMEEQNEVLRQIEENTRPEGKKEEKKKEEDGGKGIFGMAWDLLKGWGKRLGGMLLSGLMSLGSMLGKGLLTAARFLLNPAVLGKLITRVFPIAMIVGSLINGIWDGFKKFAETGSIGEALIAGLGGILEFLSFGLIDAETLTNMIESFTGFVDEYITQPLKSFFNNIKEAVAGFFENIGIPEISFSVFGKKIAFGPWYPFKPGDNPPGSEAPPEGNQPARVEGADQSKAPSAASKGLPENQLRTDADKDKEIINKYAKEEAAKYGNKAPTPQDYTAAATRLRRERLQGQTAPVSYDQKRVDNANQIQKATEKRYQEKLAKAPKNLKDDIDYQNTLRDRAEMEVRAERTKAATQPPTNANQVYNKSAENQARKEQKPAPAPVVVAPSTNVNNNNQTVATYYAPRNNESTMNDYVRRRAVG